MITGSLAPLTLALLAVCVVLLGWRAPAAYRSAWAPTRPPASRPTDGSRLFRLRRPRAGARRTAELEWIEALAAELSAGRDPHSALVAASTARSGPAGSSIVVCPHALAAARAGADVAPALLADGARSEIVRGVAACWEVASGSGAGLGASLAVLADAARETERVRRELQAGLAEPRATAVVLAALPALGLLLGSMLGADPVHWLLSSRLGVLVLVTGLALEAVGAWWAWRIASSLESQL